MPLSLSRLYGKLPRWCSPDTFEFYAKRASTLSAWADVRVGFPSALKRVVALMAFFCSIHSFLCNCGDRMERLDRHLTSEVCNTLSMAKTSGKACVLSTRTITYSISLYYYYSSIVRTFNVTPSNLYVVEATHSEHPGGSLYLFLLLLLCYYCYYSYYYYSYFYHYYYCYYYYYHYYYYYYYYYYLLL